MTGFAGAAPYTSRAREEMHPDLRERFEELERLWGLRYMYRRLKITCTARNPPAQKLLWEQGRTLPGGKVTNCDGYVVLSNHNHPLSRAVDVAVMLRTAEPTVIKPVISWNAALYRPLLGLAREVGLVSGGGWKQKDWPHLELPWEVA